MPVPTDRIPSVLPEGALPYQSAQGATPEAFGAGITSALKARGVAATERQVQQAYLLHLRPELAGNAAPAATKGQ